MKARRLILTTGVALVLVVPAAHAANATNRLHYKARAHTVLSAKGQQAAAKSRSGKSSTVAALNHQSQVRQAVLRVGAAVGSATPIEANTNDDYDNAQALYGNQSTAAPADSLSSAQSPTLIDGYLLITQN